MHTFLLCPGNSLPMMDVNMRQQLVCHLSVGHYNPRAHNQTVRNRTVASSRIQPHRLSRSTSQAVRAWIGCWALLAVFSNSLRTSGCQDGIECRTGGRPLILPRTVHYTAASIPLLQPVAKFHPGPESVPGRRPVSRLATRFSVCAPGRGMFDFARCRHGLQSLLK
jgi:hypothetical protein